jgi:hypothetical protein
MASKIIVVAAGLTYEAPQGNVIERVYAIAAAASQNITCSGPIIFNQAETATDAVFLLVQNTPLFIEGPFTKVVNSGSTYSIVYIK